MKNLGNCVVVSTLEGADKVARSISFGERFNIIFESTNIKIYFFDIIQNHIPEVSIINCDSKLDRFLRDINNIYDFVIFDNVKKCPDINIIKEIKNKILIC